MKKNEISSAAANVLAFSKNIIPSAARFYGTTWEKRDSYYVPIPVVEHSVKGTISNRMKKVAADDPAKLNLSEERANLHTVDVAFLGILEDTLKVHFTVKFLNNVFMPAACDNPVHQLRIQQMGDTYKAQYGFKELAHRYATNIANGSFLWRNRLGADKIEVQVKDLAGKKWTFNSFDYSLKDFDVHTKDLDNLASDIADVLTDKNSCLILDIQAYAKIGSGEEVYPSQELFAPASGQNSKSKYLYSIDNTAAFHAQKVGNALRRIDTWYEEYDNIGIPLPIEVYGSVSTMGRVFRPANGSDNFYTLFDQLTLGDNPELIKEIDADKAHYVTALLIRGGVFSQGKD